MQAITQLTGSENPVWWFDGGRMKPLN